MTHLERLLLTLAIIFCSLAAGWSLRRLGDTGIRALSPARIDHLRHWLQTVAIFILIPLSAMLSLWGLPQPEPGLLALPLLGLASYICGGLLALLAARLLKLDRPQTGSFFCCGTFTNIGAVGGLVCLLFLGENSIALVALYRLLEEIYYFSIAFPIARWFGPDNRNQRLNFRAFRPGGMLIAIVCALLLGIALNLLGIYRPAPCSPIASASLLTATIFFLFAIGLTLRISRVWGYIPQSLTMCAIKFAGLPLVIIPLAALAGYGTYESGLPLRTAAILCSMPVAMTALVPPAMFRLDVDLANSCWIVTTCGLVLALPLLMLALPYL
ncbi:MAG: hypothetical protein HDQ91_00635 [Desulfovibrio sp.]|nr:hypothetical protein [Desulfovibrio sp.]